MWSTLWTVVLTHRTHTQALIALACQRVERTEWNAQKGMHRMESTSTEVAVRKHTRFSFTDVEIESTSSDCKRDGRKVEHTVDCGF